MSDFAAAFCRQMNSGGALPKDMNSMRAACLLTQASNPEFPSYALRRVSGFGSVRHRGRGLRPGQGRGTQRVPRRRHPSERQGRRRPDLRTARRSRQAQLDLRRQRAAMRVKLGERAEATATALAS